MKRRQQLMLKEIGVICFLVLFVTQEVYTQTTSQETEIPCDDTTTLRPPDSTCPPNTIGARGIDGFIESSTIQSCSQFDGQDLDCGGGNATSIVLGLRPGQGEALSFDLQLLTYQPIPNPETTSNAKCSAISNGQCVVIEKVKLTVSASNAVLTYSLQDTNIDAYYAYTNIHGGAATPRDEDDEDLECGTLPTHKSYISKYKDQDYFSRGCIPGRMIDDGDEFGMNIYPETYDCLEHTSTGHHNWDTIQKRSIYEFCTVPYPKTQDDPSRAADKDLEETSGMERLDNPVSYGEYRFPSYVRMCRDGDDNIDPKDDDDGCYVRCAAETSGTQDLSEQLAKWDYFDADTKIPIGCYERCAKKYSILTDNQPCRAWAGNYFTNMAVQGADFIPPPDVITPKEVKDNLKEYLSQIESGVSQQRASTLANSLVSKYGHFNYAAYTWQKRPICPGCPGPYGGWDYWLLPRKPNTDLPHGINKKSSGPSFYPHYSQCYQDDDECCDAFVYQDVGKAEPEIPRAECRSALDPSICPLRRGIWNFNGFPDDDNSDIEKDYYQNAEIDDPSVFLPSFMDDSTFDALQNGLPRYKKFLCEIATPLSDVDCDRFGETFFSTDEYWAFAGLAVGTFAIALIFTPLTLGLGTITVAAAGLVTFLTLLFTQGSGGASIDVMTTATAIGFMYPTCHAYSIREQPGLSVQVNANLKFFDNPNDPGIDLTVSNLATASRRGSKEEPGATATTGDNYSQQSQASSIDKSFFMRILNVDSTAVKLGSNLQGVVTVCNATNNLIFEADDEDLTANPWDDVIPRSEGIYTTLPGQMFQGDPFYGQSDRHPNKCDGSEDCNDYSWWYNCTSMLD